MDKDEKSNVEQLSESQTVDTQTQETQSQSTIESQQTTHAPAKYLFAMNMQRAGEIFNNIAAVASIALGFALLGLVAMPFAMFLNWIVAIGIVVITLGTILLPGGIPFQSLIIFRSENISAFSEFIFKAMPIVLYIVLGCSVISLVALCFNKKNLSVGRIVLSSILILGSVIGVIIASMAI